MIKFDVLNRWTGKVQFTAEIECDEHDISRFKVGLAVRWALKNGANLRDANLIGADLRDANLIGADLRGADLSGADLIGANLIGANLIGANLIGAYMRGANLSGADLRDANLRDAGLRDANLSDANLGNAPKIENIHQAVYEAASAPGALDMGTWHLCGTTHCRAGWVVVLAGDEGKALEDKVGTACAAAAIYLASDPNIGKFPSFYCSNAEALADMKARAEAEKAGAP